jgi:hypothetical protein
MSNNSVNSNSSTNISGSTSEILSGNSIKTVIDFYQYLDDLFEQDADSDTLFAGSYLRGFFSLVATDFGDESQTISAELLKAVSEKLTQAKAELTPQDHAIVSNFWLDTQAKVSLK